MYRWSIILVALLLATTTPTTQAEDIGRIVNGLFTNVDQVPFIVQLRDSNGIQFCGGSLVTPQHVVTAAHCFDTIPYQSVTVVGGATKVIEMGQKRRIVGFIKPPGYTSQNFHNDVAILKLDRPMVGNNIKTVKLCSRQLMAGDAIQVSGWGRIVDGGPSSQHLRTVNLPLIAGKDCQAMHTGYSGMQITSTMMCALAANQDACHGDSGGPGINNGELCDIVSWGTRCAGGIPTVYTNVYALRSYIESSVRSLA